MRRLLMSLAVATALCAPGMAQAGAFGDDMSKCVVRSTSPADQKDLVLWIFGAISAHPDAAVYVSMTQPQRDALTLKAAGMMQRLLTIDCRKEAVAALKYEGMPAIQQAFGVLGQVAMQGLMSHPAVGKNMEVLGAAVDEQKMGDLFKEAGVAPDGEPAKK